LELADKLAADHPNKPSYRSLQADALGACGKRLLDSGSYREAEKVLRRSLALQEKLASDFPGVFDYQSVLGYRHFVLGQLLEKTGHIVEAEQAYGRALALYDRGAAEFPLLPACRTMAATLRARHLGPLLASQGRIREADKVYTEIAAIYRRMAADFPTGFLHKLADVNLGETYAQLGHMLIAAGRLEEAGRTFSDMEVVCQKAAKDYPDVAVNRSNLADCLTSQGELLKIAGKLADAEQLYPRALAVQQKVVIDAPADPSFRETLALIHLHLATARALMDKRAQAAQDLKEGVAVFNKLLAENPHVAKYRHELAWFLANFPDDQLRDPRRALDLLKLELEHQSQEAGVWLTAGIARYRLGKWDAALEALKHAIKLRKGGDGNDWFYVAFAHAQLRQGEQASKAFERAVQWMERNRPNDPELRRLRTEATAVLRQEQPQ
jgi:tetratricopeptide (TPR) repeat protein